MNEELRQIKKIYGEEMMHLCRELFPTILEKEGQLIKILKSVLAPTHCFAEIVRKSQCEGEFKAWIYNHMATSKTTKVETSKSPYELMSQAGYDLYECHSEKEIQSFKRFYARHEELCTFQGGRLERCIVFFAVKKNVDEIKRENFPNPDREDEYGTSVISIQFSKDNYCTVSIKNRYNHVVKNPDSTFFNNLENIIPGLTSSFEKHCGVKLHQSLNNEEFLNDIGFIEATNGKYYYCNMEQNDIFYCENNIIIVHGKVMDQYAQNKERYVLIDQYVVDLKDKIIFNPIDGQSDSFINSIMEIGPIKNMFLAKNDNNRFIKINYEDGTNAEVEINRNNSIVKYNNDQVKEIGEGFLTYNPNIESVMLGNATKIGNGFLSTSSRVKNISLPKTEEIGNSFLLSSMRLKNLSLPEVKKIGRGFLNNGRNLMGVYLPKVEEVGDYFLFGNREMEEIELPELRIVGSNFLRHNIIMNEIYLPKAKEIGDNFLMANDEISDIYLPEVEKIGGHFMETNNTLNSIYLPKVEIIGKNFLSFNKKMESLSLPELEEVGACFMMSNDSMKNLSLPKLRIVGRGFLYSHDQFAKGFANDNTQNSDSSGELSDSGISRT